MDKVRCFCKAVLEIIHTMFHILCRVIVTCRNSKVSPNGEETEKHKRETQRKKMEFLKKRQ